MHHLSAVAVAGACRIHETGQRNYRMEDVQPVVTRFLQVRNLHNKCIQMTVPYFLVDFVVCWLARLRNVFGGRFVQSFNPDVIAQLKALTFLDN